MKLPFLAYGARHGYGWLNGKDVPFSVREDFRRVAGKMPDFEMGETCSCGAVNTEQDVLIYCFMRETCADSRKRDGVYLAMTFLPRSKASEVDVEWILKSSLFQTPVPIPPEAFDYEETPYQSPQWMLPTTLNPRGIFSADGSLSGACRILATVPGTLKIMRTEPQEGSGSIYVYHPPTPPISPMLPIPPIPFENSIEPPVITDCVDGKLATGRRGCPWLLAMIVSGTLFLVGIVVGFGLSRWFAPPFADGRRGANTALDE